MMLTVIKYGGNAIADLNNLADFAWQIKKLSASGKILLVHGGGPQINSLAEKLELKSHFVNGQRYTDEDTLQVVEYVLCAEVNKALVRALLAVNLDAVGISGQDGRLIEALPNAELGLVGEIQKVNPAILEALLNANFIPVVAPLGLSPQLKPLNINADFSSASLAKALSAQRFILLSNVRGILNKNGERFNHLTLSQLTDLIDDNTIYGGMIPKVQCLQEALQSCQEAIILHADDFGDFLTNPENYGTKITR